jgi:pimeloyl-ACP methyl ester carboxylesterase
MRRAARCGRSRLGRRLLCLGQVAAILAGCAAAGSTFRLRDGPRSVSTGTPAGRGAEAVRAAEARLWTSLGVTARERRVHLRRLGGDVRVQEVGSGPPILFIHGGSTCGTSWADLAAALPGRRCLLLDRPGTGLSDPLPVAVRDVAALRGLADVLVADVLDALDLAQADIVATSFGGSFALRGALATPERIGSTVIVGWTAGAPVGRLPWMLRLGITPILGDLLGRLPVNRAAVVAIFRAIGSGEAIADGRISPEAVDAYVALLRHTPTLGNDRALGRLIFSARGGLDRQFLLTAVERARIASPVAFLWGGRDAFGDESVARAFVAPFPNARLEVLSGAGHALWLDDLEAAVRFVEESLPASAGP